MIRSSVMRTKRAIPVLFAVRWSRSCFMFMMTANVSDAVSVCTMSTHFDGAVCPEEIIEFYTGILRGTDERFKSADAFKAAEFFIKYFAMLDKRDADAQSVIIIDDINAETREVSGNGDT